MNSANGTNITQWDAALLSFANRITKALVILDGECHNIDIEKFTCNVKISFTDTLFIDVPLKVLKNAQASFIEIPKEGSRCEICFRSKSLQRPQILMVHEVDQILITVDKEDGIVFNGGKNSGMVLVTPLHSRIKDIEDKVNTIINKLNSTVIPLAPSGVYPLTTIFSSVSPIPVKDIKDITNKNIKQ